jgi:autotransporter-associated beta strand protein
VNSLTASATQSSNITLFGLKIANGANLSGSGTLAFSADADGKMPGLIAVGSSTIANPIALGTSAVANSEFSIRVADPAGTLTLSGAISGGSQSIGDSIRPIVKSGEGRLVLRNQLNTGWLGGGLMINEGVVRVDGGSFVPSGSDPKSVVIMPGTTLELTNGAAIGGSNNGGMAIGGTLRSISGSNNFGTIGSIFGSPTIQVDSGTLTIATANFTGSGIITLMGAGSGVANGIGNISNSTFLNAGTGTWAFGNNGTLQPNGLLLQSAPGPMLLSSRTVLTGTSTNANYANNKLQADAGGYVGANYANPRQGDTSSNANYDFIVAFNKAATLGTIGIDGGNTFSGASLDLTGFGSTARLGSTTTGTISGTTTITPQDDTFRFGGGGGVLTVGSVLADGGAGRGLNMGTSGSLAAGTVLLTGSSTYSGDTVITAGTVRLGVDGGLPSGSGKGNLVFDTPANAAVLDLNGFDTTVNGLSSGSSATTMVINSATGTTKTLTVGGNDATSTFGGVLANNAGTGGTLALTKIGTGTFMLTGSNGYNGATAVNAGKLLVNGQLGNTAVAVNASGLLGGGGTILGDVTVGSSGTLSPGNSPGVLTVGSLSLVAGSHTLMEITGTSASLYDQIVGTGVGGLSYGGNLDLVMSGSYADQTTFHLFRNFTSNTGDFTAVSLDATGAYADLIFTGTGGVWTSTWTTNQQRLVFSTSTGELVVVPEPSTYAMLIAGLACGGWRMMRRRRLRQAATLAA